MLRFKKPRGIQSLRIYNNIITLRAKKRVTKVGNSKKNISYIGILESIKQPIYLLEVLLDRSRYY